MPRPTNKEYRAAILGAFDNHMHRTLKEVNHHLQSTDNARYFINEQSTRRMLKRMTDEGLLLTLGRGEKNALIYTKAVFNPFQTFQTLDGESVSLLEFVQHVDALESRLINPQALGMLKHLMLGYLAGTYDKPFIAKGKTPVAKEDARAGLTELIKFLSSYHALVKSFLDNKIWDEHNRDSIAKQFKENLAVIHAYLVDKDYVSESR